MTDAGSGPDPEAILKKTASIMVTAEPLDFTPWVYFWMTATYPTGGGKKVGENLKFEKDKGPFELTITLDDNSGLGLKFERDFASAMWVSVGPTCPTEAGDGNGAITLVSRADLKLVVTNANEVAEMLSFALRFVGNPSGGGSPSYVYDPRIINRGHV